MTTYKDIGNELGGLVGKASNFHEMLQDSMKGYATIEPLFEKWQNFFIDNHGFMEKLWRSLWQDQKY